MFRLPIPRVHPQEPPRTVRWSQASGQNGQVQAATGAAVDVISAPRRKRYASHMIRRKPRGSGRCGNQSCHTVSRFRARQGLAGAGTPPPGGGTNRDGVARMPNHLSARCSRPGRTGGSRPSCSALATSQPQAPALRAASRSRRMANPARADQAGVRRATHERRSTSPGPGRRRRRRAQASSRSRAAANVAAAPSNRPGRACGRHAGRATARRAPAVQNIPAARRWSESIRCRTPARCVSHVRPPPGTVRAPRPHRCNPASTQNSIAGSACRMARNTVTCAAPPVSASRSAAYRRLDAQCSHSVRAMLTGSLPAHRLETIGRYDWRSPRTARTTWPRIRSRTGMSCTARGAMGHRAGKADRSEREYLRLHALPLLPGKASDA